MTFIYRGFPKDYGPSDCADASWSGPAITENPIRQITDAKLVDGGIGVIVTLSGICESNSSLPP